MTASPAPHPSPPRHDLRPATRPTFYFVGVTTAKSSIMKVFPKWARHLELGDCVLAGIDCRPHDEPDVYRRIVSFIKSDPLSLGALVTTHKIDLLDASRDLFDQLDPHAALLGEVSCISKSDGRLAGHAKDPMTSGLALAAFLADDYWARTGADVCILGAGGSSLALTVHLASLPDDRRPGRILVTNRSAPRLESMRAIHRQMEFPIPIEYFHCPAPAANDAVVANLKPHSMVVNATGLGKDAPGSPVTDAVSFPESGIIWEFNYRGDLVFLDQAHAQEKPRRLRIEDGWLYFIYGWLSVMAEVFHRDLPLAGPAFDELCRIAAAMRPWWPVP